MSPDPWAFQRWAREQVVGHPVRKLMLTSLSTMVETNTGYCFASQEDLAKYAECSKRSAVTHLQKLEDSGFILRRKRSAKWGRLPDGFLLLAPWVTCWPTGEPIPSRLTEQSAIGACSTDASTLSATHVAHERPKERPSAVEPSAQPKKKTREQLEDDARKGSLRVTHNRMVAKKSDVMLATQLLDAYVSETSQHRVRIIDGVGSPTEEFREILGVVMRNPEIEPAQWHRTLHTVLANPWWGEGPPTVGVVFGRRIVGKNLIDPAHGRRSQHGVQAPIVRKRLEDLDLG
jgi:biotin operon repressor